MHGNFYLQLQIKDKRTFTHAKSFPGKLTQHTVQKRALLPEKEEEAKTQTAFKRDG